MTRVVPDADPVVSTTSCTPTGLWRNNLLISWKKTTPNFLFPPCEGEYLSGRKDSCFLTSSSAVRGGECNWTASSVMICLQLRARSPELGAHWNTEQSVWSEAATLSEWCSTYPSAHCFHFWPFSQLWKVRILLLIEDELFVGFVVLKKFCDLCRSWSRKYVHIWVGSSLKASAARELYTID